MVTSLLSASAWRAKYCTQQAIQRAFSSKRTAVVVGATSGIGQACAYRLAEQGFIVVAVGRDRPGRKEEIVEALKEKSGSNSPEHEFYACDAFSLKDVYETGQKIREKHNKIDALVMSQGMATTQGFTPTKEGNDEKLTLHYYSRMCMIESLLPALKKSDMPAVVVSILSGGVHSPYHNYAKDPSLKNSYSIKNAADAAGMFNDLGLDHYAIENSSIYFIHQSPGFINTNWGTEFHPLLRGFVRLMQPLGRKPSDCAEYMMSSVLAAEAGDPLPPAKNSKVHILGQYGQALDVTNSHTEEAREIIWNHTVEVFKEAGIPMDAQVEK